MSEKFHKEPTYIRGVAQTRSNTSPHASLYANYVVAGNLVFISGQTAIDPDTGCCVVNTMQEQVMIVMEKIDKIMQEVGSSMENLIKDFIILKDMKDYPVMRATQQEYYRLHAPALLDSPPGSTVLQPHKLVRPYYLLEVEAVGYIPDKK